MKFNYLLGSITFILFFSTHCLAFGNELTCQKLLVTVENPDVEKLVSNLKNIGAPIILSRRIAENYPEVARRVLKRYPNNSEWVVVYRGVRTSVSQYDPFYSSSITEALINDSITGDWVTKNLHDARTMAGESGIVLKMLIPLDLWNMLRGRSASQATLPRHWLFNILPRRDLWTVEYLNENSVAGLRSSEIEASNWLNYPF